MGVVHLDILFLERIKGLQTYSRLGEGTPLDYSQ